MARQEFWSNRGKYVLTLVSASILLSSIGILTNNVAAVHDVGSVSNIQSGTNAKHVNTHGDTNNKAMHVKSPSHVPPSLIEQFLQSKLCKNKCNHPKS